MSSLVNFLSRRSTVWIFLFLSLICQLLIYFLLQPLVSPSEVIALQLSPQREQFDAILQNWGEAGIKNFLRHYLVDFFYPVVYATFLASLISQFKIVKRESTAFKFIIAVPFAAGFFDWIENVCHIALVKNWLPLSSWIFTLALTSAWIKFGLIFFAIFCLYSLTLRSRNPLIKF